MQKRILDLFKLKGHIALIIGGNRGLGLSMAKALAEAGASISIAARDENINETAIKEIQGETAPKRSFYLQTIRSDWCLRRVAFLNLNQSLCSVRVIEIGI